MPVLTEPPSMGDVLKYEVNPNYNREVITLLQGMPYPVGSVLGKITASGKYTLSPATGADGSQVASAVLLHAVDATLASVHLGQVVDLQRKVHHSSFRGSAQRPGVSSSRA